MHRSLASIPTLTLLIGTPMIMVAQEPVLQEHWWMSTSENTVFHTILADTSSNTVYVAASGDATYGCPGSTAFGAVLDTEEGWPTLNGCTMNWSVRDVVPDGTGGWIICGAFYEIDGVVRDGIARLFADGSLDPAWDIGLVLGGSPPSVNALAVHDGIVYVGGSFEQIGGIARHCLAAIDIATATVTPWNQGFPNGIVNVLTIGDGVVYAGGTFNTLGGQTRSRLAALDMNTGAATAWDPGGEGEIFALEYGDGTVYVGGTFTQISGTPRSNIGAIDATTGALLPWDPEADNTVQAIAVAGDTVFVGGFFTTIGGAGRNNLAALRGDVPQANALDWDPGPNGTVIYCLHVAGDVVYTGGEFTTIGTNTAARAHLAAIERSTGVTTAWNPSANYPLVRTFAYNGTSIYAGGDFSMLGIRSRPGVAAFDMATGKPTEWAARTEDQDAAVHSMALKGDTLFLGGAFAVINGIARQNIAAVSKITGEVLDWEISTDQVVSALVIDGDRLYLGGDFSLVNGVSRAGLAAVDIPTASIIDPWQADVSGGVQGVTTLQLSNGRLYAGGDFTAISGIPKPALAALDPTTGQALAWEPEIDPSGVLPFIASGSRVFTTELSSIVVLDTLIGTVDPTWDCNCTGGLALETGGDLLYSNDLDASGLIALGQASGIATAWAPLFGESEVVVDIHRAGSYLFACGDLTSVDGSDRRGLAVWSVPQEFEDQGTAVPTVAEVGTLHVSPNPSTGQCTLHVEGLNGPYRTELFDPRGRNMGLIQKSLEGGRYSLDLGAVADGVYLLKVTSSKGTLTERVVLQR